MRIEYEKNLAWANDKTIIELDHRKISWFNSLANQ